MNSKLFFYILVFDWQVQQNNFSYLCSQHAKYLLDSVARPVLSDDAGCYDSHNNNNCSYQPILVHLNNLHKRQPITVHIRKLIELT